MEDPAASTPAFSGVPDFSPALLTETPDPTPNSGPAILRI